MFRFKSIRGRLYSLVPATLLVVGLAVGLGLFVQYRYGLDGAVADSLVANKEFLSDIQPATLVVTIPYITILELQTEEQQDKIDRLFDRLEDEKRTYTESRDQWLRDLPPGEARRLVERDLHDAARAIFEAAEGEYRTLLRSPKRDQARISAVLQNKITPQFEKQRQIAERLASQTRDLVTAERREATESARFWSGTNLVVSILAVTILVSLKWAVARGIVRATDSLNARVNELASGASDLTARVPVTSDDELGQLARSINAMIEKIQGIVGKVRESSLQLLAVASEIAATARNQEQIVSNLTSSTTQVAASVREISATSKDLAGTMNEVSTSASHASELATTGRDNTTKMAAEMKQLVESTTSVSTRLGSIREKADSINAVVTTITKVADQTNLLSINAAIEAEKAGEYGRGFLVVAREIRRLADQTAVATLDIETMVRHMQDAVSAGVMQMDKFADEVRSGVGQVTRINQMTYEIINEVESLSGRFSLVNEGMKNQSVGAQQINDAMTQITDAARRTVQAIQEFERATTHLRGSVESLNGEISQFKT